MSWSLLAILELIKKQMIQPLPICLARFSVLSPGETTILSVSPFTHIFQAGHLRIIFPIADLNLHINLFPPVQK
jgi:hypothetical protein